MFPLHHVGFLVAMADVAGAMVSLWVASEVALCTRHITKQKGIVDLVSADPVSMVV